MLACMHYPGGLYVKTQDRNNEAGCRSIDALTVYGRLVREGWFGSRAADCNIELTGNMFSASAYVWEY